MGASKKQKGHVPHLLEGEGRGVLPQAGIVGLIEGKKITASAPIEKGQVQPASLDLRLGEKAYRLRAGFLPGREGRVMERLERLVYHELDLRKGAVLERGCVYLIPLAESLNLPSHISGLANPKSSTGRLDIFTRLLTDYAGSFDSVRAGYHGGLYLEVSPQSFTVRVASGSRLSQLRLRCGAAKIFDDGELLALHKRQRLVGDEPLIQNGLSLSVDLEGGEEQIIGYRALAHTNLIDVDRVGAYEVSDFWQPIKRPKEGGIVLSPDEFYILASREKLAIPSEYAAEMLPFNPLYGEFRVHYAGFFDPGFGVGKKGAPNARAVLEVRSREVPFVLEHGQRVGSLLFEKLTEKPKSVYGGAIQSNYQGQGLRLSKHFRPG